MKKGGVGVVVTLGLFRRGARDDAAQVLGAKFSAPTLPIDADRRVPIF